MTPEDRAEERQQQAATVRAAAVSLAERAAEGIAADGALSFAKAAKQLAITADLLEPMP